jgi:hypothetical protein
MITRTLLLGLLLCAGTAPAMAIESQSALVAARAKLSRDQGVLVRCSAAFALHARLAAEGKADPALPASLAGRGKEYFVRAGAQLIDEAGLSREEVTLLMEDEISHLADPVVLAATLPGCIRSLEASGL